MFIVISLHGIARCDDDYAAAFLDIGIGARALGMGGAYTSLADDGTAFYWNPAGLGFIDKTSLTGMYGPQFGLFDNPLGQFHFLGLAQPLPMGAVISVNWIRLSVDDIPVYSDLAGGSYWDRLHNMSLRPSGEPEGYIQDKEDALFFSFSRMNRLQLDLGWGYYDVGIDIPFGVNFKWIRQTLGDAEGSGLGVDVGAMVRFHLDDFIQNENLGLLSWGIVFQDMTGTKLSWSTKHRDTLDRNVKWGVSYTQPIPAIKGNVRLAYDHASRWGGFHSFGAELEGFGVFALRAGVQDGRFTTGAGLRFWNLTVDYAFQSHELDALHRISCALSLF